MRRLRKETRLKAGWACQSWHNLTHSSCIQAAEDNNDEIQYEDYEDFEDNEEPVDDGITYEEEDYDEPVEPAELEGWDHEEPRSREQLWLCRFTQSTFDSITHRQANMANRKPLSFRDVLPNCEDATSFRLHSQIVTGTVTPL